MPTIVFVVVKIWDKQSNSQYCSSASTLNIGKYSGNLHSNEQTWSAGVRLLKIPSACISDQDDQEIIKGSVGEL